MKESDIISAIKQAAAPYGYLPRPPQGPNNIGNTLQAALGIKHSTINKNKLGRFLINGTTSRPNSGERTNLFAKVANWKTSHLKSSAELLNVAGKPSDKKGVSLSLNCTVGMKPLNRRNLELRFDDNTRELWEVFVHENGEEKKLLHWPEESLLTKIKAKILPQVIVRCEKSAGLFMLREALVYDDPVPARFFDLLKDGSITLDHLISKTYRSGGVTEKGPLFKIRNSARVRLYDSSRIIDLLKDN
ncbi:MvaI/BcnI restriction endonuclease family protein [Akkermansiaceae bacterium]|nr:MvaI/BcnI restriction endonuclease family protein [Akkermansiaceae bacterium]MDA8958549.1 MvaI/BcnI restriction endonuclease family protein [bacterium]MDB4426330.1 MvaI/BcnI restriction endonuclease family protein [bacterium]MDB4456963.1 MvaI/BcnI restriction endonuclease family protein [Akkermansiaceae bacterium]MDB4697704.1 MvaI/BcnI restriction endonuclease family protein [Akkermansiaceae bacterium]